MPEQTIDNAECDPRPAMTIPEQAVAAAWPTHCIHGRSVNGPEWCPDCKRLGLDPEVTDVAWKILQALHENVPEAERPMSWSDVNGDQEQRIRTAAVAAIETVRARDAARPLMGVQRPEDVVEKCAQIVEHYTRDASFDDSVIGAGEHSANQINIANAIRQLALPHTGQPQEGDHERDRQVVKPIGQER